MYESVECSLENHANDDAIERPDIQRFITASFGRLIKMKFIRVEEIAVMARPFQYY